MFLIDIRLKKSVLKPLMRINTLEFVPDQYKTQEMCDKAVFKNLFMLKYCHDKYKTQKICYC